MTQESCNGENCSRQLKLTLESGLHQPSTTYWALDHAPPCEHSDPLCRPPSLITRPDNTPQQYAHRLQYIEQPLLGLCAAGLGELGKRLEALRLVDRQLRQDLSI